jgi:hypothetical protein
MTSCEANAYGSAFQQFDWFSDRVVLTRRSRMKATSVGELTGRCCAELIRNVFCAAIVYSGEGEWFVTK